MHSHSPLCTCNSKSWLPIISFLSFFFDWRNGKQQTKKREKTTEAISQKWKMNFGKSDALNSGGLLLIVLFVKKEILSKEIKLYKRSTFLFESTQEEMAESKENFAFLNEMAKHIWSCTKLLQFYLFWQSNFFQSFSLLSSLDMKNINWKSY